MLIIADVYSVHAASLLDQDVTDHHAGNWARSRCDASLAVRHRAVRWHYRKERHHVPAAEGVRFTYLKPPPTPSAPSENLRDGGS